MNTFVLYIEDDEKNAGHLRVSAEVFGDPETAMNYGKAIMISLSNDKYVKIVNNSVYTQYPATNLAQ
jgi:hypothetical protein